MQSTLIDLLFLTVQHLKEAMLFRASSIPWKRETLLISYKRNWQVFEMPAATITSPHQMQMKFSKKKKWTDWKIDPKLLLGQCSCKRYHPRWMDLLLEYSLMMERNANSVVKSSTEQNSGCCCVTCYSIECESGYNPVSMDVTDCLHDSSSSSSPPLSKIKIYKNTNKEEEEESFLILFLYIFVSPLLCAVCFVQFHCSCN